MSLLHPDEFGGVVAAAGGFGEDCGFHGFIEYGGAGEDPKEFGGAAADEDVLVVRIEVHDTVVAVEGTEEGYFQDAGIVGEFGFALDVAVFAVLDAGVEDLDTAVFGEGVAGLGVLDAALEDMVEACDFIPLAEVFVELEVSGDGVVHFGLGVAAGAYEEDGREVH